MYTDNTILTFGKYKFTKLCRVPILYLTNIYNNKSISDKEFLLYIENRLKGRIVIEKNEITCQKFPLFSEKLAKEHLKRIANEKSKGNKKPIRAYECQKCGGWHLTSKTIEEYEDIISIHNNKKS